MMRRALLVLVVAAALAGIPVPASAQTDAEALTIEIVGVDGGRLEFGRGRFIGPLRFTQHADGIAVTEVVTIEQYLHGIAEVPFAWPEAALEAQAIAARTYLARGLLGGRSGDEEAYGFDICASSACQVYRGVQYVEGAYGERWRAAVDTTEDEILLWRGEPIEAVYTSMVGNRSRANQDVWSSNPVPYLQPVDSPEVGTAPFAEWVLTVSADQFVGILAADGLDVGGALRAIRVDDPPEGEGRTTITVVTSGGTDAILAPAMRGAFNRHGPDLYPETLPARRADGRRLPDALLSYTYDVTLVRQPPSPINAFLPEDDRIGDHVRIEGEGWGHGVGMSQWGARAMADQGASHEEILTHYYTAVELAESPDFLPETVVVGLDWGEAAVTVTVDGLAEVSVNGISFVSLPTGEWMVRSVPGGISVTAVGDTPPPVGLIGQRWPF